MPSASINQNGEYPSTLPAFCNLGVSLRILLAVDLASVLAALIKAGNFVGLQDELIALSVFVQPVLLASLILLCLLNNPLHRLPYYMGMIAVAGLTLLLTAVMYQASVAYFSLAAGGLIVALVFCLCATATLLLYFHLRQRALSPALDEARLQALQARIRPHFLFNSLNAVLGLIRTEPRRAERVLEDLAELFRALMGDSRRLVTLQKEIELCRGYLELEQLRLGERLHVDWHIDKMPNDALIPPLVVQPLLENAVYYGIEPSSGAGLISINIYRNRKQVHIVLRNPYLTEGHHHQGNKMALTNITQRLALHYDAEASLMHNITGQIYQVHIIIPYITSDERP